MKMKNIKTPYAGINRKGKEPGVYPLDRDYVVYLFKPQGGRGKQAGIYADRKFKTEEAANIYFKEQSKEVARLQETGQG